MELDRSKTVGADELLLILFQEAIVRGYIEGKELAFPGATVHNAKAPISIKIAPHEVREKTIIEWRPFKRLCLSRCDAEGQQSFDEASVADVKRGLWAENAKGCPRSIRNRVQALKVKPESFNVFSVFAAKFKTNGAWRKNTPVSSKKSEPVGFRSFIDDVEVIGIDGIPAIALAILA